MHVANPFWRSTRTLTWRGKYMTAFGVKKVRDAKGTQIIQGSIVHIQKGSWQNIDGLVVAPHSTFEGGSLEENAHSVAIFLGREVGADHFAKPSYVVGEWDAEHMRRFAVYGETEFLFEESILKECPRIIHCKPEDLVVIKGWSIKALVERLFRNRYHAYSMAVVPEGHELTSFLCQLAGCQNSAGRIAFVNIHGYVSGMLTCAECFKSVNGLQSDALPEVKSEILFLDGTPYKNP